ncbi:hypothetical protein J6590_037802 [Homalodisca vitripennis]|nr:hypothetical protein J6590_037802 [Homalodisca vitripennis]
MAPLQWDSSALLIHFDVHSCCAGFYFHFRHSELNISDYERLDYSYKIQCLTFDGTISLRKLFIGLPNSSSDRAGRKRGARRADRWAGIGTGDAFRASLNPAKSECVSGVQNCGGYTL